jgi:WD40 repeat protein
MSEERRARVRALFDVATELPPEKRGAFLEAACSGDPGLRAEVESLLAFDADSLPDAADDPFLKSPILRLGPKAQPAMPPLPERIGHYRVLRLLGEGGMGTVYEAEQDNPRRTVALKVIRPGLVSSGLLRRFAHEAQILGTLHHPGIAQIYEAGVADDGQPFFALELIHGLALDEYARRQALNPEGRLDLVARVCDAVQHAHDRGVIHRDLKPGNVLVDDTGQPRVLDFGVARAAGADLLTSTDRTRTGQLVGTLSYMSPEQASGDPSAIDARSDVYAVGVILYELLAHRLPYRLDGLPLPEAARVIRDQEPSRLGSIDSRLRGDVETIVAKALAKDQARRYASAGELAADIRRFLNHEPIRARPASALYQLRRFARRHKALVGSVLGVMAALAGGTVVSVLYAVRADHNAHLADENARQAQHQTYLARLAAAAAALSHHDVADAARQLEAAPEQLRGWEWRYLHARLDDSAAVLPAGYLLRQGPSEFRQLHLTPDAVILSNEDGRMISSTARRHPPGGWPTIQGTGDKMWLMAELREQDTGAIRLLDSTGQERLLQLPPHRQSVGGMEFSPDGHRLAVLHRDQSISICDVSACRETAYLARDGSSFNALAFSEDGRRLAVAADSPAVFVWDTDTGHAIVELRTQRPRVMAVAFDPHGDRLLTASPDGTVQQWDVRSGREVEPHYDRHEGEVNALAYSPDGQRVASAGVDRAVRLWRAQGRQDETVFHGHTRSVIRLTFSRDGRRLASTQDDGVVRLWDTASHALLPVLRGHSSYVYPVAYVPDGRLIASGSWDGTVRLWDAGSGQPVAALPQGGIVRALALSPNGTRLLTMGDGTDGLHIWDVSSHRPVATYKVAEGQLWAAAYRPGRTDIAVRGQEHIIEILDATTGNRLAMVDAGGLLVGYAARLGLAYSPDGRLLASTYKGNEIGLWEADTYRLVGALSGHVGTVLSVAFSADGRRLVSAGADSVIRVWDVESQDCRLTLRGHADEVFAAVFHPDGSRIASGGRDRLVRLWDTATGEELVRLPGHSSYVYSLAFSPDGKTLVSSSGDSTLRLWDTEPLRERSRLRRAAESLPPKTR